MRGIQSIKVFLFQTVGITPAHAGNTEQAKPGDSTD